MKDCNDLVNDLSNFKLLSTFYIMSDLIDLYLNESDCNEGELSLEFLNKVYNYLNENFYQLFILCLI